jgi:hypothetical protein
VEWLQVVNPVLTLAGIMFTGYMTYKIAALTALSKDTHKLVNSEHGIALTTVFEQAMELKRLNPGNIDIAARADAAKTKLDDHIRKQASVDAGHDR